MKMSEELTPPTDEQIYNTLKHCQAVGGDIAMVVTWLYDHRAAHLEEDLLISEQREALYAVALEEISTLLSGENARDRSNAYAARNIAETALSGSGEWELSEQD